MKNTQAIKDLNVLIKSVKNNEQMFVEDYEKEFYIGILQAVVKYLHDKDEERKNKVK